MAAGLMRFIGFPFILNIGDLLLQLIDAQPEVNDIRYVLERPFWNIFGVVIPLGGGKRHAPDALGVAYGPALFDQELGLLLALDRGFPSVVILRFLGSLFGINDLVS